MAQYLEYIKKASSLIEALPYIQAFRGESILVKFGGSVLEEEMIFQSALRDIVFLECVGIKPVIVHGGGKAISSKLNEMNIQTRFINGLRHTCEESIRIVDEVLHETVNPRLVDSIHRFGGKSECISGKDIMRAKKLHAEEDLGFVGEVTSVNIKPIKDLMAQNIVPVITPLAQDSKGEAYNINADIAACQIAQALKVRKLVFMSDVPGILEDQDNEESLISSMKISDVQDYIDKGVITGGMVPKIRSAVEALEAGTNKVHMIDARIQHSILLEIFTDSGVGSQIIH